MDIIILTCLSVKNAEMPNNPQLDIQRLQSLKQRFKKDESFHKDHTSFVNDVLTEGYAEVVSQEEVEGTKGPHRATSWGVPPQEENPQSCI